MVFTLLRDICRPHVIDIILLLKRGTGLSVNELSAALRMSYMGVKQHCVYLEKKGYLDTWRRPKEGGGRPEKMYRTTAKIDSLFPREPGDIANDMLEAARGEFGDEAVERLLTAFFQQRVKRYENKIKGKTLMDRAQSLAKRRMQEGCISYCEFDAHQGLRIIEFFTPLATLIHHYPAAMKLKAAMFSHLLQCHVEAIDGGSGAHVRHEFRLRAWADKEG